MTFNFSLVDSRFAEWCQAEMPAPTGQATLYHQTNSGNEEEKQRERNHFTCNHLHTKLLSPSDQCSNYYHHEDMVQHQQQRWLLISALVARMVCQVMPVLFMSQLIIFESKCDDQIFCLHHFLQHCRPIKYFWPYIASKNRPILGVRPTFWKQELFGLQFTGPYCIHNKVFFILDKRFFSS